ncbi:MAG: alkaline phosphatase D family protein [Betaproteobacteria bacterium]|nr:alkaline phosphatase D family protein [Betaproteobacteria bacterium]
MSAPDPTGAATRTAPGRLARGLPVLWQRLVQADEANAPEVFDLVIVGSGYGGSIAAEHFAGAATAAGGRSGQPFKVLLLERGNEYLPGEFPGRFADLPRHVRLADRDGSRTRFNQLGLFDLRLGDDVAVLVANGLGGGSLINAGVLLEPEPADFVPGPWREQLQRLRDRGTFGEARRLVAGAADGSEPASIVMHPDLPQRRLRKTIALEALAAAAGTPCTNPPVAMAMGARVNGAGVELPACTLCGDCLTGCNVGAKDSLDANLLRRAAGRPGFEVFTGASVLSLRRGPTRDDERAFGDKGAPPERHWVLRVAHTDPRLQERETALLHVRARHVILAAGTLGSTEILLHSRTDSLVFSDRLGAGFSCNGDNLAAVSGMKQPVRACAPETEPAGKPGRHVGPTITASLRVEGRRPFLVQEFAVPAALARLFDEAVTTSRVLASLPVPDREDHLEGHPQQDPCAVDRRVMAHTLLVGVIGHDDAAGVLVLPKNPRPADRPVQQGTLRVRWPEARYGCDLEDAHRRLGDLVRALPPGEWGAPQLLANPAWRLLPDPLENLVSQPRGPVLTVHPLGGCAIGARPDGAAPGHPEGVVDAAGRVYDLAPADKDSDDWFGSLVVLDGSMIPGSLGVNPALTIAAVALDACRALAVEWSVSTAAHAPVPDDDPPPVRPIIRPTVQPPHPLPGVAPGETAVEVVERLTGPVRLQGGREFHVELTLAYRETMLQPLMSTLARGLDVRPEVSRLRLFRRDDWDDAAADLRAAGDAERQPFVAFEAPLSGTLRFLHREPRSRWRRVLGAAWAWLRNRGLRDIWQYLTEPKPPLRARPSCGVVAERPPRLLSWLAAARRRIAVFVAMAGRAGEVRRFDYELTIGRATIDQLDGASPGEGGRIAGHKRLTYNCRANPWQQLTQLTLTAFPHLAGRAQLELDARFLAERGLPLMRIKRQHDGASALADLASFGLYLARVLLGIHLWTFRRPDTPSLDTPQRLPGAVAGLPAPEVTELEVDRPTPAGLPVKVRLTRYAKPLAADLPPLVMVHGYSVSGTTFTHPSLEPSAAGWFWQGDAERGGGGRRGREVWVIDLRTSAGLPTATEPWAIEQPALVDLPAALLHIRNATGRRVDVLAHCVGCAMLGMALLTDARQVHRRGTQLGIDTWLTSEQLGVLAAFNGTGPGPHPCVRRVVLSQKGPVLRYTDGNVLRAWVMQTMRRVLLDDDYQFRPPGEPTISGDLLDRLLASLPYPAEDYDVENPLVPWRRTRWTRTRHRMDALYGRDFNAQNLRRATLDAIDDLFGPIHLATVAQTIHFARFGMVTNQSGRGEYVTLKNLSRRWAGIPTLAVHGRDNGLADVSTQQLLREHLTRAGVPFEGEVFAGMGHQDSLIGRGAVRVFERIGRFLDANETAAARCEIGADDVHTVPWLGPRIDLPDDDRGELRIACMSRPDQGPCRLVLVPAVQQAGRLPQPLDWPDCTIDGRREANGGSGHWLFATVNRKCLAALAERAAEVADGEVGWLALVAYAVADTTARRSRRPAGGGGSTGAPPGLKRQPQGRGQIGDPDFGGRAGERIRPLRVQEVARDEPASAAVPSPPDLPAPPADGLPPRPLPDLPEGTAAADGRRAFVSLADLQHAQHMLDAEAPLPKLAVALGSCQYAAALPDAVPAWASLRGVVRHLDETDLVLFVGDQIYADATGGLADPTRSDERYEHPSEEALRVPPMRDILRRRPARMLLDDHEIDDNWEPPNRQVAAMRPADARSRLEGLHSGLAAWYRYQRMRRKPARAPSADLEFRHGGYPFFMLDTRTQRSARGTPVRAEDVQLIDEQQQRRLAQWLLQHRADVKFVVAPSLLLPPRLATAHELAEPALRGCTIGNDDWDGYPRTLAWLVELLAAEGIGRTVFLSGDEHHAMCCEATLRLPGQDDVQLVSVHGSALYAPYPFANGRPQDLLGSGRVQIGAVEVELATVFSEPGDGHVRVVVGQGGNGSTTGGATLEVAFCKGDTQAPSAPIRIELR